MNRGSYTITKNKLILNLLDNVRAQMRCLRLTDQGQWVEDPGAGLPQIEGVSVSAVDADVDDQACGSAPSAPATALATARNTHSPPPLLAGLAHNLVVPPPHNAQSFRCKWCAAWLPAAVSS